MRRTRHRGRRAAAGAGESGRSRAGGACMAAHAPAQHARRPAACAAPRWARPSRGRPYWVKSLPRPAARRRRQQHARSGAGGGFRTCAHTNTIGSTLLRTDSSSRPKLASSADSLARPPPPPPPPLLAAQGLLEELRADRLAPRSGGLGRRAVGGSARAEVLRVLCSSTAAQGAHQQQRRNRRTAALRRAYLLHHTLPALIP